MRSDVQAKIPDPRPKVAVALGGIGVRAAAAIPLFEFLDEAGVETDLLIGSSGGAVYAAMRGAGITPARMRGFVDEIRRGKLYSRIDYRTLFGFAHPKLAKPGIGYALKKADRIQELYRRIFGSRRLEDLRPTTLLQTVDCIAGEGVVLDSGPLADTVYASSSMAPEFPPIQVNGRWLADGAYMAPVPVLEAVKRQADVIIALYHEEEPKPSPEDLLESNYNILAAYFGRLTRDQVMLAIELHHHEIILAPVRFDSYIGPWETAALPTVIEAGRKSVERIKDEILRVVPGLAARER